MFRLEIDTDKAAFQGDNQSFEIAKVVQRVVIRIEQGEHGGVCWDSNGNNIGNWSLDLDDDEAEEARRRDMAKGAIAHKRGRIAKGQKP